MIYIVFQKNYRLYRGGETEMRLYVFLRESFLKEKAHKKDRTSAYAEVLWRFYLPLMDFS